jgi:hypothetical protein
MMEQERERKAPSPQQVLFGLTLTADPVNLTTRWKLGETQLVVSADSQDSPTLYSSALEVVSMHTGLSQQRCQELYGKVLLQFLKGHVDPYRSVPIRPGQRTSRQFYDL